MKGGCKTKIFINLCWCIFVPGESSLCSNYSWRFFHFFYTFMARNYSLPGKSSSSLASRRPPRMSCDPPGGNTQWLFWFCVNGKQSSETLNRGVRLRPCTGMKFKWFGDLMCAWPVCVSLLCFCDPTKRCSGTGTQPWDLPFIVVNIVCSAIQGWSIFAS